MELYEAQISSLVSISDIVKLSISNSETPGAFTQSHSIKNAGTRILIPTAHAPNPPSTDDGVNPGLSALAAPVNPDKGLVVAAVSVEVPGVVAAVALVGAGAGPLREVVVCAGVDSAIVALRLANCACACTESVALTETVVVVVIWVEVSSVVKSMAMYVK